MRASNEAGPSALIGRKVFVLHPHQTRFVIPTDAAVPLPDNVPPARAMRMVTSGWTRADSATIRHAGMRPVAI